MDDTVNSYDGLTSIRFAPMSGNMGAPVHDMFSDDMGVMTSQGSLPIFSSDPLAADFLHTPPGQSIGLTR